MAETHPVRILFVCGGNTCRSPMAVALCKKMFGDQVYAESAGVDAYGESASKEAVQVLRARFDLDLSDHVPRDVEVVPTDRFEYVVAMEPHIADDLATRLRVPKAKLIVWAIKDPYGQGIPAYERCVAQVTERLREVAGGLGMSVR